MERSPTGVQASGPAPDSVVAQVKASALTSVDAQRASDTHFRFSNSCFLSGEEGGAGMNLSPSWLLLLR